MSKMVDEFLQTVCEEIRCKTVHSRIREELKNHISDLKEEYIEQGLSEEIALKKAISAMGNPKEIGQDLHKQHKPQMGWGLILLLLGVSVFGVLMLLSPNPYGGQLERQVVFMVLGMGAMFLICYSDYTKWQKHPFLLYGIGMSLIYLCTQFGWQISGAKRYLAVGGITFYIPGVASVFFMISFCGLLKRYQNQGWKGIWKLMMFGSLSVCGILMLPSFTYAFILAVAYGVVLLRAVYQKHFSQDGVRQFRVIMFFSLFVLTAFVVLALCSEPLRLRRLLVFFDHGASDPHNNGWMYVMAHKILMASQWIGKATPIPEGDINFIMPDITSGFALLNLIASYGILVGIVVIVLAIALIVKMYKTSNQIQNSFGRNLSLGCCVLLSIQFIMNILMNLGYFPIGEICMPFVSSVGSHYLIDACYLGVILSAWRFNKIFPAEPKREEVAVCKVPRRKVISLEGSKLIIDLGIDFFEE